MPPPLILLRSFFSSPLHKITPVSWPLFFLGLSPVTPTTQRVYPNIAFRKTPGPRQPTSQNRGETSQTQTLPQDCFFFVPSDHVVCEPVRPPPCPSTSFNCLVLTLSGSFRCHPQMIFLLRQPLWFERRGGAAPPPVPTCFLFPLFLLISLAVLSCLIPWFLNKIADGLRTVPLAFLGWAPVFFFSTLFPSVYWFCGAVSFLRSRLFFYVRSLL